MRKLFNASTVFAAFALVTGSRSVGSTRAGPQVDNRHEHSMLQVDDHHSGLASRKNLEEALAAQPLSDQASTAAKDTLPLRFLMSQRHSNLLEALSEYWPAARELKLTRAEKELQVQDERARVDIQVLEDEIKTYEERIGTIEKELMTEASGAQPQDVKQGDSELAQATKDLAAAKSRLNHAVLWQKTIAVRSSELSEQHGKYLHGVWSHRVLVALVLAALGAVIAYWQYKGGEKIPLVPFLPPSVERYVSSSYLIVQDLDHLGLLLTFTIGLVMFVQDAISVYKFGCWAYYCKTELLGLVFLSPCTFFLFQTIGYYDDRRQTRKAALLEMKNEMHASNTALIDEMDGLLQKATGSAAGHAERNFEALKRDFVRFTDHIIKCCSTSTHVAPSAEDEALLIQFRRFAHHWLGVFASSSLKPIEFPRFGDPVRFKDALLCSTTETSAQALKDLLDDEEVSYIQSDRKLIAVWKEESEKKRSGRYRGEYSSLRHDCCPCSWGECGGRTGFSYSSSPNHVFPMVLSWGCGRCTLYSRQHLIIILGVCFGFCLMGFYILAQCGAFTFLVGTVNPSAVGEAAIVLYTCGLIVLLLHFERIDVVMQISTEIQAIEADKEAIIMLRARTEQYYGDQQLLVEFWLHRIVPRLELVKEICVRIEDLPDGTTNAKRTDMLRHACDALEALPDSVFVEGYEMYKAGQNDTEESSDHLSGRRLEDWVDKIRSAPGGLDGLLRGFSSAPRPIEAAKSS